MEYLHTMVRVGNLDAALDFFVNKLGLVETRRIDRPEGRYTLVFLAAPGDVERARDAKAPLVELTHNWGVERYEIGTGYGHIALAVEDAYAACDAIKTRGGKVTREAGPMKGGSTVIAFVEDPDGYKIELIQRTEHAPGQGLR